MINAALDIIMFLKSNFGLLFALALYTTLSIALYKSIKKNYKVYYWIFGVASFCFIIPMACRLLGVTLPFSFGSIPLLGLASSELSSAANFIHPILIIIMYMGALDIKNKYVGRLMSIRKELSIIVGFPVLAHVMKRLFGSFLSGLEFFFNNEEFMQSPRVSSALGSGITSFAFVLGLFMAILFLVLWVTSFDSVRKKMGAKCWKSVQRWSYGLYAMLFLHSLCLQLGGYISDSARDAQKARVEVVAPAVGHDHSHGQQQAQPQAQQGHDHSHGQQQPQAQQGHGQQQPQAQQGHGHGRPKSFAFADIKISKATLRLVNIFILFAIYGSYLYLRLGKAKRDRLRKAGGRI